MNSEDSRNLILAIVLSLAVLIGWNYFYGAPQLQKDRQAQTQANAPAGAGQSSSGAGVA
jgi:YidC/Oxa1 family membrane protein insertase